MIDRTDDTDALVVHSFSPTGLPVVVAIIETGDGFFHVGFSAASRARFDEEIATILAERAAKRAMERFIGSRKGRRPAP